MGVFAGPDLKEDGLVLCLDAGNNKSHSTNRFISYGTGLTTENVSFSINGDGTFKRVAAETVIGGYTVKPTDVVYSYALGSNGCHYHGNSAPIPSGVYATFSFDYLVTGATNYPSTDYLANFENYGGGALGNSIGIANTAQDVWQRRTFTVGPTSSAGSQAMFLYPGGCGNRLADSGTIYFRNPRVEWTNVDTGTGNFSSMSNLTTWYDLNNRTNNGTLTNTPYHFIGNTSTGSNGYISFDGVNDYINHSPPLPSGQQKYTLSAWWKTTASNTNQTVYEQNHSSLTTNRRSAILLISTGFWGLNGESNDAHDKVPIRVNQWTYGVITIDTTLGTNPIKIYENGGLYWQGDSSGGASNLNMGNSYCAIGKKVTNSEYFIGNIAQVQIYNRALSAQEIQQNYNTTKSRFGL